MLNEHLTEEALRFGQGGRLFGILTLPLVRPDNSNALPTFVFLNAGLLHRVGPFGLYVRLARMLAGMGFVSLRVDLNGKGDSAGRTGMDNEESVAADFRELSAVLDARFGPKQLVLAGLCSAADDAIRLATANERVIGLCMLDPFCYADDGFEARKFLLKYSDARRYLDWLKRNMHIDTPESDDEIAASNGSDGTEVRDIRLLRTPPTLEQLRTAFRAICHRHGRAISIFSRTALVYYNKLGQLEHVVNVEGYDNYCEERYWPDVGHTYDLEFQRERLVRHIECWAAGFIMMSKQPKVS